MTVGDDFEREWRAWVAPFAAGPRDAFSSMKANVLQATVEPLATTIADESRRMVLCAQTDDHREAVRAWLEQRPPVFRRET